MKLGIVTSYYVKCGIAEYSKNLFSGLMETPGNNLEPYVFAKRVDRTHYPDGPNILRSWGYPGGIQDTMRSMQALGFENPDIIHFQQEWGLMGWIDDWLRTIHSLKIHPKVFVTPHWVGPDNTWAQNHYMIDGLILHSPHMRLPCADLGPKTHIIPHGCPVAPKTDPQEAKDRLGISSRHVLSTFGFLFGHKGLDLIVRAMPLIQARFSDAELYMLSSFYGEGETTNRPYEDLRALISQIGANVKILPFLFEQEQFLPYLQASDIFISQQEPTDRWAVSGSSLLGLTARRPIIINSATFYYHLRPYAIQAENLKPESIADRAIHLFEDPALYRHYQQLSEHGYEAYNWRRVAELHLKAYREAVWGRYLMRPEVVRNYQYPPHYDYGYLEPDHAGRVAWLKQRSQGFTLEVGCATGYVLMTVEGHVGIDLCRERLIQAHKRLPGCDFIRADASHLPLRDKIFDTVLMPEILEHVYPWTAIWSLKEAVRVGKRILVSVPTSCYDSPEHVWVTNQDSLNLLTREAGIILRLEPITNFLMGESS